MRRLHAIRGLAGGAAVVLALGIAWGCSTLVQPADPQIRFSHKYHIEDQGLACGDCHGDVAASGSLAQAGLPKEEKCLECHEKTTDNCKMCHTDPAKPGTWRVERQQGVDFSHKLHADKGKGDCTNCHKDMAKRTAPPARYDVTHDTCMACHRKDYRKVDCKMCHSDLVDSPSAPLGLYSHEGDFLKRHGTLARGDRTVCEHCHRQQDCTDCHNRLDALVPAERMSERVDRSLVHRADFLTRHPIDAKANPDSCRACHAETQCTACHEQSRVGQSKTGWDRPSPHPRGWATNTGSPDFHGRVARRDIASCAACHDQGAQSNCVECHKVGGQVGRKPHPAGWDPQMSKDSPACRACHR
jgi:hypothetical protein